MVSFGIDPGGNLSRSHSSDRVGCLKCFDVFQCKAHVAAQRDGGYLELMAISVYPFLGDLPPFGKLHCRQELTTCLCTQLKSPPCSTDNTINAKLVL